MNFKEKAFSNDHGKKKFFIGILVILLFSSHCLAQSAGSAAVIKYGKVEDAQTIEKDARHAGGALAEGLAGLAFAGPRHRALKMAKDELAKAGSDADVDLAIKKVRVLCDN